MIAFTCPHCSQRLKMDDHAAAMRVRCPSCGGVAVVPASSVASADIADRMTLQPSLPGPSQGNLRQPSRRSQSSSHGSIAPERYAFLAPALGLGEMGRLGTYCILKVLGAGGMGVVFEAEDTQLQRPVALKAMLPALAAGPSNRQRFIREAQLAAKLNHDHIVTVYHVGEDRGVPYLAMQLLRGETLEARLRRDKVLPVDTVVQIGREIAEGLMAAHEQNLIHRDVKPGNIFLEAGRDRVKILDFGLARAHGDAHLTKSGALVGTLAYMAPEQASARPVDHRADLFSLGVVLYRACTGMLPFRGRDTLSMLAALALETPRPVEEVNENVPPALADLIMRLLARDPNDRPSSADAVVGVLTAIKNGATGTLYESRLAVVELVESEGLSSPRPDDNTKVMEPRRRNRGRARQGESSRGHAELLAAGIAAVVMGSVLLIGLLALVFLSGNTRGTSEGSAQTVPQGKSEEPKPFLAVPQEAAKGPLPIERPAPARPRRQPPPIFFLMDPRDRPEHWTVLFRSDNPGIWNTDHPSFALPLTQAPETIRYLRLRREDNGDSLILALTRQQLVATEIPHPGRTHAWNGSSHFKYGGHHLGIAHNTRMKFPAPAGPITLTMEGWDGFPGSGFGHKTFVNEKAGQCYCWRNQEIPRTVFEIAVTDDPLTEAETRCLVP
jgi:serine/threonine protein kinase